MLVDTLAGKHLVFLFKTKMSDAHACFSERMCACAFVYVNFWCVARVYVHMRVHMQVCMSAVSTRQRRHTHPVGCRFARHTLPHTTTKHA